MSRENQDIIIVQCDTDGGFINPGFQMSGDIDLEENITNEQELKTIATSQFYSTLDLPQKEKTCHGKIGDSRESATKEEEIKTTETSQFYSTLGSYQKEKDGHGEIEDSEESATNEQERKTIETLQFCNTLGSYQKEKDEHGEIKDSEESATNEQERKTIETSQFYNTLGSHIKGKDEHGEICDSEENATNEETETSQFYNEMGSYEKREDSHDDALSKAAQISEFVEGNRENAAKDNCDNKRQEILEYQNDNLKNNSLTCVSLESESIRYEPSRREPENSGAEKDKNSINEKKKYDSSKNLDTEYETISSLVKSLHCRRNAAVSAADIPELKIIMEQKEKKKKKYNVILDKGWAWMVLLSSFLAHIIVDGAASSFGVFYVLFLEEFGKSRGLTSWIGSLQVSLMYLMGNLLQIICII